MPEDRRTPIHRRNGLGLFDLAAFNFTIGALVILLVAGLKNHDSPFWLVMIGCGFMIASLSIACFALIRRRLNTKE